MDSWKEITIGALIAQGIAGAYLYLRSIGAKVSRTDHDKAIAELKSDYEKAIAAVKSELDKTNAELKGDFRRFETKIDGKLDTIQAQLMTLLARRPE